MNEFMLGRSITSMMHYALLSATFFDILESLHELKEDVVFSTDTELMRKEFKKRLHDVHLDVRKKLISNNDGDLKKSEDADELNAKIKISLSQASDLVGEAMAHHFDNDNHATSDNKTEEDIIAAVFRWNVFYQQVIVLISDEVEVETDFDEKTMSLIISKNMDSWRLVFKGFGKDTHLCESYLNDKCVTSAYRKEDLGSNPITAMLSQIGMMFIWETQEVITQIDDDEAQKAIGDYINSSQPEQNPIILTSDKIQ